jgi:DNA-binding transcriptional LysR family regulator
MDRLAELQALVEVGRSASFTRAAETLRVTPSAVSKQVRALEDRLGVRLLDRTTRRVALTDEGRVFMERASNILQEVDDLERALVDRRSEAKGPLRVSLPNDFGRRHLTQPLAAFTSLHPALELDVEFNDRFVSVVDEGFDVVVRIGESADSSLVARRLGPCRRWICAAPGYLARHGHPRTPEDLRRGHQRLAFAHETDRSWLFDGPAGPERIDVPIRHRTNNGEQIRCWAAGGEGVALLPTFLIADELRSGALIALLRDALRADTSIYALYPHRRHLSPRVRVFVDFMTEHCGEAPPWDEGLDALS